MTFLDFILYFSCLFNILITILLTCCSFVIDVYVNVWYFHNVFRFVFVCNVFWVEFQPYCCCCCCCCYCWSIWLLLLLLLLLVYLAHLAFRSCELLSSLFVRRLSSVIRRPSVNISHCNLLLRNHWANCNQTLVEWSLDGPLPKLCPVIPTYNQDGLQAKNRKKGGCNFNCPLLL